MSYNCAAWEMAVRSCMLRGRKGGLLNVARVPAGTAVSVGCTLCPFVYDPHDLQQPVGLGVLVTPLRSTSHFSDWCPCMCLVMRGGCLGQPGVVGAFGWVYLVEDRAGGATVVM